MNYHGQSPWYPSPLSGVGKYVIARFTHGQRPWYSRVIIEIEKLRKFLKKKLSADWIDDVSDEDIARDASGDTIGISTDEHFVLFNLNKKNFIIDLYLDDQRSFDLSTKESEGMRDVYWDTTYDSQLHLLTTKILSNPTLEIKTKPNTA